MMESASVTLAQFGDDLRCTMMRAPINYAEPEQGELQVAVMRVSALKPAPGNSPAYLGSMLLNPGGPGGDGLVLAPLIASRWRTPIPGQKVDSMYQEIAASYDLIGFSPRGTGASTLLKCSSDEMEVFANNPAKDRSPQNIAAMLHNARLYAVACAKNPLTPHINSEATARDMDLMRHLLGDDKLNYYGASYGTWLGVWYATVFPERVGRMLLAGMVDLEVSLPRTFLLQPMGYQRAFDQVLVHYANRHPEIFFNRRAINDLARVFPALDVPLQAVVSDVVTGHLGNSKNAIKGILTLVAAHAVQELIQRNDVQTLVAQERLDEAQALITGALKEMELVGPTPAGGPPSQDLPAIARSQAAALVEGYFEQLRRPTSTVKLKGRAALGYAISSNDSALGLTQAQWIQATDANALSYPLAGGLFTGWPGLFWSAPSVTRPPLQRIALNTPLAILQTDLDPQTVVEGAERSVAALSQAGVVLITGEYSHAPMVPYGKACVDEPIAHYFLQGQALPRRTTCTANTLPWDSAVGTDERAVNRYDFREGSKS